MAFMHGLEDNGKAYQPALRKESYNSSNSRVAGKMMKYDGPIDIILTNRRAEFLEEHEEVENEIIRAVPQPYDFVSFNQFQGKS
jgi:hypothetical protein